MYLQAIKKNRGLKTIPSAGQETFDVCKGRKIKITNNAGAQQSIQVSTANIYIKGKQRFFKYNIEH